MGIRHIHIMVFALMIHPSLHVQNNNTKGAYIRTFPEKITARVGLVNTGNSFFFNDSENAINYNLKPNTREYLGFSLLFRSIELDFGFLPNFLKQNQDNENSKLFNLNFRMFLGQWMKTLDLYQQKGFFADLNGSELILPSVETFKIGGSISYIFNKNFSFRAVGFQNEWQRRSSGSFIPGLHYYYTTFNVEENNTSSKANSFDIAVAPAYYYNFVVKEKFIFGIGASTGIGFNHNNLGKRKISSMLFEFGGRAVLGYNSESFFAGINSSVNLFEHNSDRAVRVEDAITFLEFYIGYRFNAPKSFIKTADRVNRFLGLK
ncbi:DUF4421 family protein [Winogradskyella alexanderae]|uniref:DUF4421 domain-containing protein n=1 Tax=Winogradskyella alexanderae TaxID=2877123 RepID=A0ABS7XMY5_9FLAO|nr:DUF4421 family protein [Winogradskyella alexanderae]MCA0131367.1 DUF4421 domain-containing protein [Winogradskyella alexanderae]